MSEGRSPAPSDPGWMSGSDDVMSVGGQKGLQMATLKHMHTGGGRGCFMRSSQRGRGGVLEGSSR